MGFFKSVKRGAIGLGLIGALAGSQYGSVPEAYQEVLKAEIQQNKNNIDYVKDNRKDYGKDLYKVRLKELQEAYSEAKDNLEDYQKMEFEDKRKKAFSDIGNYGLTIKNLEIGMPNSRKRLEGTGKGAVIGLAAGSVLGGGLSIRGEIKKRREKKNLEKRLSVFLSLIAGGIGASMVFSNFSGVVTGNVIKTGAYQSSGILGIVLLIAGCVGTYFYFKN